MTDPPFLSIPKTKSLCTGEEEDAPSIKGSMGLRYAEVLLEMG